MKRTIFFIQILLLLTAGSAFGADEYIEGRCGLSPNYNRTYWWGLCLSGLWSNPDCWGWEMGLPGLNDVAAIDNPLPTTCVVDSTAECLALYIGDWPANSMSQGDGEIPQTATLDVNGGTLTVVQDVMIGMRDTTLPSDYAIGDFNIISGNVTVGCDLYIGREGIGYLNMRGGTLDVNGTIWCPGWQLPEYPSQTYEYGTGYLNLYGGTIEANDLTAYDEDGGITRINIMGGTLIVDGNEVAKFNNYIDQGKLFAYGGIGEVIMDYNVTNPGKTTVTADVNLADVNFIGYSFFAAHWGDTNCGSANDCDGCDFDSSGTVDVNDLDILCGRWLEDAEP